MALSGSFQIERTLNAAASVYSRGPEIPPLSVPRKWGRTYSPATHDLPEINLLNHQIAQAQGTTMALVTTRVRLQDAKKERRLSLPETLDRKWRQWKRQEDKNRFFRNCLRIFNDLATVAVKVSEDLTLQSKFEPEVSPVGNRRIFSAIRQLQTVLSDSQEREVRAREEWDIRSNLSRIRPLSSRWI